MNAPSIIQDYSLYAAAGVAVVGVLVVIWLTTRRKAVEAGMRVASKGQAIKQPCSVCQNLMVFSLRDLGSLMKEEMGLLVRVRPDLVGKTVKDYVCPHCEAVHLFRVTGRGYEWIGANIGLPQTSGNNCMECHTALLRPPWPRGTHEGPVHKIPDLPANIGLVCARCGAVVCVACCRRASRGRTTDGSFICPRCTRQPVDKVHYF